MRDLGQAVDELGEPVIHEGQRVAATEQHFFDGHITCDPSNRVALLGDFNIAPRDNDVWDRAAFEGATHVTDAERDALAEIKAWGLTDAFEHRYPDVDGLFTYYDYTAGRFHKRQGMRIDLILATESLIEAMSGVMIDRNGRKNYDGHKPSDHVPIYADFDI